MYYKQMDQIIPYEVDNVRIRYYANDKAKAYAKGIDFKVNGEFVKDLESWFSLSFMSTQEDIYNDKINIKDVSGIDSAIIYPGYIPRPTDQRFNFSVFFQDNFKNDPPNATLSVYEGSNKENTLAVIEISHPVMEGKDLLYKYKVIEGEMPKSGGATALFIDWIGAGGGVGPGFHGVGAGTRGVGLTGGYGGPAR
jgi:hypothetical protein